MCLRTGILEQLHHGSDDHDDVGAALELLVLLLHDELLAALDDLDVYMAQEQSHEQAIERASEREPVRRHSHLEVATSLTLTNGPSSRRHILLLQVQDRSIGLIEHARIPGSLLGTGFFVGCTQTRTHTDSRYQRQAMAATHVEQHIDRYL